MKWNISSTNTVKSRGPNVDAWGTLFRSTRQSRLPLFSQVGTYMYLRDSLLSDHQYVHLNRKLEALQ